MEQEQECEPKSANQAVGLGSDREKRLETMELLESKETQGEVEEDIGEDDGETGRRWWQAL